jgi:hydroxymethylbilane synthase
MRREAGVRAKIFTAIPLKNHKTQALVRLSSRFCVAYRTNAGFHLGALSMSAPAPSHSPPAPARIRIASRESRLAMVQSEWTAEKLRRLYPDAIIEIVGMTTRGDQILDQPLAQIGGKGLFIKELEVAMEEGRADIAVHSMKDVPMTLPAGFAAVIVGERADVHDALVSNRFAAISELPQGAVVGTSSLRRESQLRTLRPDLKVEALRGNVNTRLAKLDAGNYDAIILAAAGLRRLGLSSRIRTVLDPAQFLPAIAQGALGIEYQAGRADMAEWLAPFALADTTAMVNAERALGRALTASCDVPLGGNATIRDGKLYLEGFVAMPDGSRMIRDAISGAPADAVRLGDALAQRLLSAGADRILASLSRNA